jgi:hypothetical protein
MLFKCVFEARLDTCAATTNPWAKDFWLWNMAILNIFWIPRSESDSALTGFNLLS